MNGEDRQSLLALSAPDRFGFCSSRRSDMPLSLNAPSLGL
jgi:hypothetical protein